MSAYAAYREARGPQQVMIRRPLWRCKRPGSLCYERPLSQSIRFSKLNIAGKDGRVFDVTLVRFALELEQLLYRLSVSAHRDSFVLKGGMLVAVWVADDNRSLEIRIFSGMGFRP